MHKDKKEISNREEVVLLACWNGKRQASGITETPYFPKKFRRPSENLGSKPMHGA